MYPFCFLGTRRDDGGCTLSADAGRVGYGKAEGIASNQQYILPLILASFCKLCYTIIKEA